jgi:2-keto-3-deoxy-L-rhamnonate aldolase RhmA
MDAAGKRAPNKLKRDLVAGKVCIGATVTLNSPVVAELMAHIGLDWLWFETEHTSMSVDSVLTMLQATNGSDITTVVRVPWNDKTMIKRILDTGPDGIIIPLINSREEAEAAVRAMKYPPRGERGAGLSRAQTYGLNMGDYLATADEEVTTIAMIEHIRAVENINEIIAVDGIDSVMIGALDLSGSMGLLGETSHPKVEEAVQTVLAACKAGGMPCGIIAGLADVANERIAQGFTNIILGIDVLFLSSAIQSQLSQVRREPALATSQ